MIDQTCAKNTYMGTVLRPVKGSVCKSKTYRCAKDELFAVERKLGTVIKKSIATTLCRKEVEGSRVKPCGSAIV